MSYNIKTVKEAAHGGSGSFNVKEKICGHYWPYDNSGNGWNLKDEMDDLMDYNLVKVAVVKNSSRSYAEDRIGEAINALTGMYAGYSLRPVVTGYEIQSNSDLYITSVFDNLDPHTVSTEEADLFDYGRSLGANIVIYFVDQIYDHVNSKYLAGFGAHPPDHRGCIVAIDNGTFNKNDLAHEMGHVFGLGHDGNQDNHMYNPASEITNLPPDMTGGQKTDITNDSEWYTAT